jgi:hypothetical protein
MAERAKRHAFGTVASVTDVAEDGKAFKGPHKAVKVQLNDGGAEYFFNLPRDAAIKAGSQVFIEFVTGHPAGDRTLWTPARFNWFNDKGEIIVTQVPPRAMGPGGT